MNLGWQSLVIFVRRVKSIAAAVVRPNRSQSVCAEINAEPLGVGLGAVTGSDRLQDCVTIEPGAGLVAFGFCELE